MDMRSSSGQFAFYEVEDEDVVSAVKNDQNHDYDNLGRSDASLT